MFSKNSLSSISHATWPSYNLILTLFPFCGGSMFPPLKSRRVYCYVTSKCRSWSLPHDSLEMLALGTHRHAVRKHRHSVTRPVRTGSHGKEPRPPGFRCRWDPGNSLCPPANYWSSRIEGGSSSPQSSQPSWCYTGDRQAFLTKLCLNYIFMN